MAAVAVNIILVSWNVIEITAIYLLDRESVHETLCWRTHITVQEINTRQRALLPVTAIYMSNLVPFDLIEVS